MAEKNGTPYRKGGSDVNVRKPTDYSDFYQGLDALVTAAYSRWSGIMKSAGLSATGRRKAPLSPPPSTLPAPTLTSPASLQGISAGCGSFTGRMQIHRKPGRKPCLSAGLKMPSFWRTAQQLKAEPGTLPLFAVFIGPKRNSWRT